MSADEENVFSMVQSRRFACDRCHRQKLRCERSPFVAKGNIIISFGACSRCVKAGVPCHITTQQPGSPTSDTINNTTNNINVDTTTTPSTTTVARKRKTPPTEIRGDAATESSSASSSGNSAVSISAPPFMQLTSIDEFDMGDISATFDGSLFDTDTVSFHDHSHFELGLDKFQGAMAAGSTSTPSGSLAPVAPSEAPSPPDHRPPELDRQRTNMGVEHDKLIGFVDPAYFEGSEAHHGESSNNKSNSHPCQSQDTVVTVEPPDADHVGSPDEIRRRRLLELHSLLLSELHCITDADLAQAFFSDESTSLPTGNANVSETNIVRRVLSASERLIDLLNGFCCPPAPAQQDQAEHRRQSSPASAITTTTSSRDTTIFGTVQDTYPSTSPPSMPSSPVELPMAISFLCCYVSLLSVYRAVFTNIYDTLRSALSDATNKKPTAASVPPFPQASRNAHPRLSHQQAGCSIEAPSAPKARRLSVLVGGSGDGLARRADRGHVGDGGTRCSGVLTRLDPPYITRQRALGIRIQLEVMAHMLDQIEDAWTGMLGSEDAHHRQPQPDPVHDTAAAAAELCSPYHRRHQYHNHPHHHDRHSQYHHVQQHLHDQEMDQSPLDSERSGLHPVGTATMQLLQSMLAHEGYSSAEGDHRMGLGSLMEIVESIRKLLRSTRFT
ncbi:hypothetical protein INS49_005348 [Diaporthe citri]|uniref:uncharacterized protein n=1 Tax=Diaporthe citri TaxID=83186 RepID=UPI001C7E3C2D|nr:uncharacterized protein INS49_005348 [Diaporthe citri]KAG6353640.1 hypothetical protein INS49_005348 [Diaporthe citri]